MLTDASSRQPCINIQPPGLGDSHGLHLPCLCQKGREVYLEAWHQALNVLGQGADESFRGALDCEQGPGDG